MKYYLINNKIMKGSKMPPTTIAVNEDYAKTEALKYHYQELYSRWKTTLQPCEISESELEKIKNKVYTFNNCHADNPIDITDIVEEKVTHQLLSMPPINCYELFFKQPKHGYIKCGDCNKFYLCTNCGAQCGSEGHFIEPKQVDGEIEAVEFAEWIHINAQPRLPNKNHWKMYNNSVVITTQELYEIFKNRK